MSVIGVVKNGLRNLEVYGSGQVLHGQVQGHGQSDEHQSGQIAVSVIGVVKNSLKSLEDHGSVLHGQAQRHGQGDEHQSGQKAKCQ